MQRSLSNRLLLVNGMGVMVALAVAWLLMSLLFYRHLERQLVVEMTRDAAAITGLIGMDANGLLTLAETYGDARFDTPASGHYWQATGQDTLLRSRSLWDTTLPSPGDASPREWTLSREAGPFGEAIFSLQRAVHMGSDVEPAPNPILIQVARNHSETHAAHTRFSHETALFLVSLWVFLMAATWVQVRLGLRPLKYISQELSRLHADPVHRMPSPRLVELDPLVQAINDLADARAADLKRARSRASDLAHSLKTPLAALSAQSTRLQRNVGGEASQGLNHAINAIRTAIDAELSRNRFAELQPGTTHALAQVEQLIRVLEQTERGETIAFSTHVPEDFVVPLIRDDLVELLGPLLENAMRFAHRQVVVTGRCTRQGRQLVIEDDGPGIPPDRIPAATLRGVRLDERGVGQGLGLSIATAIAEASGGELTLGSSALGGLQAAIHWPAPAGKPATAHRRPRQR